MSTRMQLENRTAVTGAASGIGRSLAEVLARRRCHLALADIDDAGLQRTAELIAMPGLRVSCHRIDVADAEAVARFPPIVQASHPGVDLLFNNAGVALGGSFEQVSEGDFEWLFGINFRGVVRMTRAFLPLLKVSDDARLVNVSSVFGLMGVPGQTAYAASKFAVRGFSESLRHEPPRRTLVRVPHRSASQAWQHRGARAALFVRCLGFDRLVSRSIRARPTRAGQRARRSDAFHARTVCPAGYRPDERLGLPPSHGGALP
jgi:NADP-dependent 3-hydroxy acid dehydrogenase YdfG